MRARFLLLALVLGSSPSFAEGLLLVTDDEVARETGYAATVDERFLPRSVPMPGAPLIQVRSPSIVEELKAPFPIRVEFKAVEGAQVLPSTFKVYYGLLKLDITDRVVRRVRVETSGVAIEEADIPAGSHKLVLQIRDSKGRLGETALSFRVAPSL